MNCASASGAINLRADASGRSATADPFIGAELLLPQIAG